MNPTIVIISIITTTSDNSSSGSSDSTTRRLDTVPVHRNEKRFEPPSPGLPLLGLPVLPRLSLGWPHAPVLDFCEQQS